MPLLEAFLKEGLVGALPLWVYILIGFVSTQLLVMSVSVYLHRAVVHKSIEVHYSLAAFCRSKFRLAQTSTEEEWGDIHLDHHTHVETPLDPHSPKYHRWWKLLFATAYRRAAKKLPPRQPTHNDWLERHFIRHRKLGVIVLAVVLVSLFGFVPGGALWVVEVIYLPVVASLGVNGFGHSLGNLGKKRFKRQDRSTNVIPIDIFSCGELLHNNHHAYPNSPKFSFAWYEFDPGWGWIKFFEAIHLVRVIRQPPSPA